MIPQIRRIEQTFYRKFLFLGSYQPLELQIQPKLGTLMSKILPKHSPHNYKTTLKKSRKSLFRPAKMSKMTPQNRQNEQIFDQQFRCLEPFINFAN